MKKLPVDVLLAAHGAISGLLTQNVRLLVLAYDGKSAKFRFYMAQEPSEDEIENADLVAFYFGEELPLKFNMRLKKIDVEFVVTSEPLGYLDVLDMPIFRRFEAYEADAAQH